VRLEGLEGQAAQLREQLKDVLTKEQLKEQLKDQMELVERGLLRIEDMEVQVAAGETKQQELDEALRATDDRAAKLVAKASRHDDDIRQRTSDGQRLQAQIAAAEKERLAELRVVCDKLEAQGVQINALPNQVRSQISGVEDGLTRALADLREETGGKLESLAQKDALHACDEKIGEVSNQLSELVAGEERIAKQMADLATFAGALDTRDSRFDALQEELRQGLAEKAGALELDRATDVLHAWVEDVRDTLGNWSKQAHQTTLSELETAKITLRRHESMLGNIWNWCQQVRTREQGLTHVIMHIVERSSPEQMKLFEEVLSVPRIPLDQD